MINFNKYPVLLILVLGLFNVKTYSQNFEIDMQESTIAYKSGTSCTYLEILPSLKNLRNFILADMDVFTNMMKSANYTLSSDQSGYVLKKCIGQDLCVITKSTGQVAMIFSGFNEISSLRREIKFAYPNVSPQFLEGFEVYSTPFIFENLNIRAQVYIQEKNDGSGMVVIKRF